MRDRDKIEKYIYSLLDKYNGEVIESYKSRYFKVDDKILRVSDHIGSNSSGCISIIVPRPSQQSQYIIHSHSTGSVAIMDYDDVKEMVRVFFKMSSFLTSINGFHSDGFEATKEEVNKLAAENKMLKEKYDKLELVKASKNNKLFGVDITKLSQKQLETLKNTLKSFQNLQTPKKS